MAKKSKGTSKTRSTAPSSSKKSTRKSTGCGKNQSSKSKNQSSKKTDAKKLVNFPWSKTVAKDSGESLQPYGPSGGKTKTERARKAKDKNNPFARGKERPLRGCNGKSIKSTRELVPYGPCEHKKLDDITNRRSPAMEVLERNEPETNHFNTPVKAGSSAAPYTKPPPRPDHVPAWEPAPHTCPICRKKTTAPDFVSRCMGGRDVALRTIGYDRRTRVVHQVPCHRHHQTLMRAGRENDCDHCATESQARWKREESVKRAQRDVDDPLIVNKKKAMEIVERLKAELHDANAKTELHAHQRFWGFWGWVNGGSKSMPGMSTDLVEE